VNNQKSIDLTYKKIYKISKKDNICLRESDLYPPSDNRVLKSFVKDIYGGDNFADYCEDIFEFLEEEGYYD
jgi:hypothetical protein